MLCIVLRTLHVLCPVISIITQWGKYYYHVHFVDEGNWGTEKSNDLPSESGWARLEPKQSGCKASYALLPFHTEDEIKAFNIWLVSSFSVPTPSISFFPLINIYSDTCWSFFPLTCSETHVCVVWALTGQGSGGDPLRIHGSHGKLAWQRVKHNRTDFLKSVEPIDQNKNRDPVSHWHLDPLPQKFLSYPGLSSW